MKYKSIIPFLIGFFLQFNLMGQDAGSTADALEVSLTGGASYSVPITVPPGIQDVAPRLSLSFNSQGGNGLAGYGWNVGGLSTITRVASTTYHDGEIDPIDFDNKDRFALDGQRLLLKSGTYGANGARYQTENYSNIKIRSVGVSTYGAAYGPRYFVVHYPDGSRGFYGNATNSRGRLEWALYKWQDTQGNFIRYTYARSGELLRITNVYYGSQGSTASPNRIRFIYANRTRTEQSYIGGISFTRSKILKRIEVLANGQLYRKYELSHDPNSMGYQRVTKIQETNGANGSLPPIEFQYLDYVDRMNQKSLTTRTVGYDIDSLNTRTLTGDFNGDGESDMIFYDRQLRNNIHIYDDLNNSVGRPDDGWEHATDRIDYLFSRTALDQNNKLMSKQGITVVSDSYYDGLTSRARFTTYSVNSTDRSLTVESAKTWDAPAYRKEYSCDDDTILKTSKRFFTGDFNGDAITDVIALTFPYTETFCNPTTDCDPDDPQPIAAQAAPPGSVNAPPTDPDCCNCTDYRRTIANSYFIDLDRRKTSDFSNYSGQIARGITYNDRIFASDFNGDGVSELIHISTGNVEVYSLENRILKLVYSLQDDAIDRTKPILPGDYNGDRKIDFAVPIQSFSRDWRFFVSTGSAFSARTIDLGFEYRASIYGAIGSDEYNYINQDFNGDGKTDILRHFVATPADGYNNRYEEQFRLFVSSNINDGFPTFEKTIDQSFFSGTTKRFGIPLLLQADTYNRNLEYAYISGRRITTYEFTKDLKEDTRLENIRNNGVVLDLDYATVQRDPDDNFPGGTYYRDNEEVYPYVNTNIAPGLEVVNAIERKGSGYVQKQNFKYKGAVSHAQGLGFLGFKQLFRTNWYGDGVTQLWTATKNSPQLRGAPVQQWSANFFSQTPSNYISKTDYDYNTVNLTNKVFVNIPNTITVEDAINGFTSTQSFIYNNNYETRRTTSSSPGGTVINNFTYYNNLGSNNRNYHVGRPRNKKTTSTIGGNTFYNEEEYTYTNNLVNTIKRKGQGTEWVTETFTRDLFGNVLTKTLSAPGLTSRTESYTYDSSGRYLMGSTDLEGLESTFSYNTLNGNLLSITDPYNRTTGYSYDGWDRPITEMDYLGKVATTTYANTPEGGIEQSSLFEGGGGTKQTYNAFGWMTRNEILSLNGKWIVTRTEYDTAGRVTELYEPYFSDASTSQRTSTSYDEYGRPISIIEYTGKVQSIVYDNLTVTTDDGTKTTTATSDSLGNILEMTDPGGSVTYTYHGNGMMKTADYGGQIVETFIDAWGRKTRLVDPSAGTYTYDYNLYGELTANTTPKGSTAYTVNDFGKLERKEIQGDETNMVLTYTYDGTDKLLRGISAVDNGTGRTYNYAYDYDSYKRLNELIETNPFARFEVRTTYDGFGRPLREAYNSRNLTDATDSNITVRNIYDTDSGMLEEISNDANNQVLWRLRAHDARGQVTRTTLGNGFRQIRGYDDYGLPKTVSDIKESEGSGGGSLNALRMNYTFDAQRGVLDNRHNVLLDWTENFDYDQFDRLTTITGAVEKTQAYDNRGRITNNTDIGDYSYGNDKIYRLAGLDLNEKGGSYYQGRERREITYNAFKKPTEIYEENEGRVSFGYSPLQQRSHAWYGGTAENKEERRFRKHYSSISPVEIVEDRQTGNTKILTYLGGDQYSATVVHVKQSTPPAGEPEGAYHYLHRDYLGSILAITDDDGNIVEQTQFGAWGAVDRHLANGEESDFGHDSLLGRGYTGHEHFFSVGLIHMNGRMYDAELGRFLSPDNYIQNPYDTQSFNRYGYVLNNPLIYSDPSGEMTEDGPGEGFSDMTGSLLANLVITAIRVVDWGAVGDWFDRTIDKIRIGRSFRALFTKNRQASAVVVSENRININPSIKSSPNVQPLFTSSGGEFNFWDSFSKGFKGTFSGFKTLFTDPLSLIRPLSFSEAMQETMGMLMPGSKVTFAQLRANTVLSSGDVDGYAEIQGGLFGDAVMDGLSLVPVGRLAKFVKLGRVAKGITVLGKYPDYINLASKLNARRFNIPSKIWNKMSSAEQWAANRKFLDRTIARGDAIRLSNPVKNINNVSGYFRKELDYLMSKGYRLNNSGTQLIK